MIKLAWRLDPGRQAGVLASPESYKTAGLNDLARRLEADDPPTQALRELMDGRDA
ncbi:MAG TPA: hypothetical protein VES73_14390 [Lamprocystis sp. (in: g-proteobacteria)]|nr:hypothetical protein [Lamprocystis sp. (in: g-proteobacteria)]